MKKVNEGFGQVTEYITDNKEKEKRKMKKGK